MQNEVSAYTIQQFCDTHNLAVSTFFKIQKEGKGPRVYKAGRRVYISVEAASDWRKRMESETPVRTV